MEYSRWLSWSERPEGEGTPGLEDPEGPGDPEGAWTQL